MASKGLPKVAGKKTNAKRKAAYAKRFGMKIKSSATGPGFMTQFKRNDVLELERVEWKQSMTVDERGLICDGEVKVPFEAGDKWSCTNMICTSGVNTFSF